MALENSGPILSRLLTKVHEIRGQCKDPSYLPTPLPDCLWHVSFSRYSPLSLKVVEKPNKCKRFLAPIFFWRDDSDFYTAVTATGICTQNFEKIDKAVPEICSRTDTQTDRRTDRRVEGNTSHPYRGGVIIHRNDNKWIVMWLAVPAVSATATLLFYSPCSPTALCRPPRNVKDSRYFTIQSASTPFPWQHVVIQYYSRIYTLCLKNKRRWCCTV